ncbi:MAG: chloramphenicol acetyltransferase CAT, partial [Saprospiraceae bacterium]|nr:chloramphenicol acetyltransferase CAT [Saprospiraceae bacterium]
YLIPIFTMGKYFQQDNKILLPMSVQVHHAVCDGYHTSRFFNEVQELVSNFETWLGEK